VHSKKFNTVRHYYVTGVWNIDRVRAAVTKQWITESEFEEITGESFNE